MEEHKLTKSLFAEGLGVEGWEQRQHWGLEAAESGGWRSKQK